MMRAMILAVRVARQHATEWHVSPDRVGFLGFSAGGMVASGALLQSNAAARPSFAAKSAVTVGNQSLSGDACAVATHRDGDGSGTCRHLRLERALESTR